MIAPEAAEGLRPRRHTNRPERAAPNAPHRSAPSPEVGEGARGAGVIRPVGPSRGRYFTVTVQVTVLEPAL